MCLGFIAAGGAAVAEQANGVGCEHLWQDGQEGKRGA